MALHVICGPPGSGKTTLANKLHRDGDLIFDFDKVAEAIAAPIDNRRGDYIGVIEALRKAVIREAANYRGTIFVIITSFKAALALERRHRAELTVLNVPSNVCVERLIKDQRPGLERRIDAVKKWWKNYVGR